MTVWPARSSSSGTALSRTLASDGRLSEDIDLIACSGRSSTAEALETTLLRATRREFPGLRWQPALTAVRDATPAVLVAPDGTTVRVQLLSSTGYAPWPTERRSLVQRYSDAGPAALSVPTAPAFAAWKTTAWAHRATSRDLYDLWLLAPRCPHHRCRRAVHTLRPHQQASVERTAHPCSRRANVAARTRRPNPPRNHRQRRTHLRPRHLARRLLAGQRRRRSPVIIRSRRVTHSDRVSVGCGDVGCS
ncbi:nucleotidyl transferase AbiEii/AbiGii toxin family protein [Halopolyspora algeriensis]|uniref:nucleotidyl transferase AbiEii/AbiGii toxin family protein n=1 Tax=Halopolyspora algeriensis TaxID=1500506 RepID=UPI0030B80E31